MKKFLFLSILAGLCLTGCTNDELVEGNDGQLSKNDYINFIFQNKNMTRADQLSNTHYEFGVFADNGEKVMENYLVGWGDASSPYKSLLDGVTTYGDPTSQVDGLSYWFYEKLSSTNHTTYTTPDQNQVLKFWDKSKASYNFWAYAPYTTKATATTAKNADQVTFTKDHNEFTFANLSSFYTSPVEGYQVTTADDAAATATDADYNAEMINYNEGLYAYSTKAKAAYGTDVPFNFNHINAKINLAFYEDIEGYKVQLMDMVPGDLTGGTFDIDAQKGIVLTPATPEQAVYYNQTTKEYKQQTVQANLAKYYAQTKVDVSGINATPATIAVGDKAVNDSVNTNLYFQATNATGTSVYGETLYIGETQAGATPSATTLYVLPNYAGSQYITPLMTEGKTDYVSSNTGYTLHVSYKLIPEDGTAKAEMYDARVYIKPQYCQWQAGKAYKYIFKITLNANGTTDPTNEIDKYTDDGPSGTITDEAYVDPTDPRVPDGAGLLPIVFDGIEVSDYADGGSTEFVITESDLETSFQKALASIKKIFSTGGMALPLTATGTGVDADNALTVEYNATVSDFKWPSWNAENPWKIDPMPTDINDNNVFKDLQALSQAMYNQEGIKKITYNSVTYEKSTDNSLNPPSWYPTSGSPTKAGESLESNIAADVFGAILLANSNAVVVGDTKYPASFTLMDGNGNETYVKLNLKVVSDPVSEP